MKTSTVSVPVEHVFDPEPLRRAMEAQGVTRAMLAAESGKHKVSITRALGGGHDGGVVSHRLVEWMCQRLGVPVYEVLKVAE